MLDNLKKLLEDTKRFTQPTISPGRFVADKTASLFRAFTGTNPVPESPPRYNSEDVKELAATVFGEASSNVKEMKAIIDTVLNRRNQLGLNIKEVLTQKDKNGLPMYQAYGGKEYNNYLSGKLDRTGEPRKKKIFDNLISELQYGNWQPSKLTNFNKETRKDTEKIGAHYFWTEFQGNRINKQ